jgi:hypothetical protein
MIKAIIAFLAAIPEIIKFIETLQAAQKEKKLNENLKTLRKAIEDGDEDAVNSLFNFNHFRFHNERKVSDNANEAGLPDAGKTKS